MVLRFARANTVRLALFEGTCCVAFGRIFFAREGEGAGGGGFGVVF